MSTLTYKSSSKHVKVNIDFSEYDERVERAYEWINQQIVTGMEPIMPKRTGKLITDTQTANTPPDKTGKIVVARGGSYIYGLYNGFNECTGLPIHYSRPGAVARWGDIEFERQESNLVDGVRKILEGKK